MSKPTVNPSAMPAVNLAIPQHAGWSAGLALDSQEPASRRVGAAPAALAASSEAGFALGRMAMISLIRDIETSAHMLRVGQIAGLVAWHLTDDAVFADLVCRAAPFHDIGKICIADAVLRKQGPLDEAEWAQMREHPAIGARLLHCPGSPLHQVAEDIAHGHHEKFDGSGYPRGLAGQSIPLSARIAAVADYFDALAMDRCYRRAWPMHQILTSLVTLSGKAFDPEVVAVLLAHQDAIANVSAMVNDRWAQISVNDFDLSDFAPLFFAER